MDKLKVKIIHYSKIFKECEFEFNPNSVEEYLRGGRQDVLDNFDIFTENVRSLNTENKNFNLFEVSEDVDKNTVIVLGFYLELFEFWGQRSKIEKVIKYYSNKYPDNKILVTWNHDVDTKDVFHFIDSYENIYVLNFNTSIDHPRYIVLPFWTINDNQIKHSKKYLLNLVCSFNNSLRFKLKDSIINFKDVLISPRVDISEYRKILSSSIFTLCPRGVGLSSYRFFECFHLNTIPVLFADDVILPFKNEIEYDKISVRIEESKCSDPDYILKTLKDVDHLETLNNINKIRKKFTLEGIQTEINKRLYDSSCINT